MPPASSAAGALEMREGMFEPHPPHLQFTSPERREPPQPVESMSANRGGFMRFRSLVLCAAIASLLAGVPGAAVALPTCEQLATNPAYGLAGNPQISGLTAVLLPAGVEPSPFPGILPDTPYTAYCKVDFTFSGESGASAGYLPGQSQHLGIRVGLPPNSV